MAKGWNATIANSLLDAALRASAYTGPAVIAMKLHISGSDPGSAGTSNPASETTRKAITYGAAAGGVSTNDSAATWTNVAASETYTNFTLWSSTTAGTFHGSGTMTANAVTAGDTFTVAIGSATVSLSVAA